MEKLPVIFRKWPESEGEDVIALFPTEVGSDSPYTCASYQHIGQHGAAEPVGVIQATRAAKPSEYADLLKELHKIGYRNLDIRQRYQHDWLDVRRRELQGIPNRPPKARYSVKTKRGARGRSDIAGLGTTR